MKSLLSSALAVIIFLPTLHAQEAPKDPKDRVSYSIGHSIGEGMKKQGVDINQEMLIRGITDGFGGAKPLLTQDEVKATMDTFQQEMQTKMLQKRKEQAEKNKKAGEDFLADNKGKEGVITLPSGLQYKILTTGKGDKPKSTDTVETNYRGTLIDGTEFDKSKEPVSFPVDRVIPGWTEALQLMPVGSKWQLFVPSNLAYGENAPPVIGPNSVLLFDVELLGIKKQEEAKPSVSVTTEPVSAPTPTPEATPTPKKKKKK